MEEVPEQRGDEAGEEGDDDLSGLDSDGSITPDPFLSEVARIPRRADLHGRMPRPGDTLGRFVIRGELGRGGMGVVFAAEDVTLGRHVALKVLPWSDDEGRRRRFLREARSAAALSDPRIATVFDVGEADGWVFIAMELVRGETLRALLERRPDAARALPAVEVRRVAGAIAGALAKAHAAGVVHRDLKPENVMIAVDGHVKLLDFGLAKVARAGSVPGAVSTTETAEGRIMGTPGYMSPEQAKGLPVDPRSDVFSFGVLLYEMLTGWRPFSGATLMELIISIDRDEPPPPSTIRTGVAKDLERVALRCLRKDAAQRYADGGALLRDLEHAPSSSRRWWAWAGAAAAISALGGLGVLGIEMLSGEASSVSPESASLPAPPPPLPPPPLLPGVGAPAAALAPAVVPTSLLDLPAPPSSKPEAVAQYREALATFRSGGTWYSALLRALELDPEMVSAHVQFALGGLAQVKTMERPREHFRRAQEKRAALSEREKSLLDAVEPVVRRQPADWASTIQRLHRLALASPGDAQIWYLLGVATANYSDFEVAIGHIERALQIDPGFSRAHGALATYHAYRGRIDEADQVLERCLEKNPGSVTCLQLKLVHRSDRGDCEGVERIARTLVATGATPATAYPLLASALASRGQPLPTVLEALRQGEEETAHFPASIAGELRRMLLVSRIRADLLGGDFGAAEKGARAVERAVAAQSRLQHERGQAALLLAWALEEQGRGAEAGKVALEFLDRRDAWEPGPGAEDSALASDVTPALLLIARRSGAIDRRGAAARREPWLSGWAARLTPVSRSFLWLHGYAALVEDERDARDALGALPRFEPLPPFRLETLVDADVGRTFLFAGEGEEATRWLKGATQRCAALEFPVEHTRAHFWLGQAREAVRDRVGACAAYRLVQARWGAARPRSVTAELARDRAKALGCGS
ncbi:serine/threonine-protein kinase [Chondromyces crocatus]|nr:serine/threonine-protein kinase [Chondromyces crocatus]